MTGIPMTGIPMTGNPVTGPQVTGTQVTPRVLFLARVMLLALLCAASASAQFVYQIDSTTPPTPVAPGATITLPNTVVGDTSTVTIRVTNAASGSAAINAVSVSGNSSGYNLNQVPNLPLTLAPGASTVVTVSFTAPKVGTFTGGVSINSDTFFLTGLGLAAQLVLSYQNGTSTITLGVANNSVIFSPVPVSQSSRVTFFVTNTGTLPTSVSNIGVAQTPSPFVVTGLPALPVKLAPGAGFNFTITATPTALGFVNGTLNIDSSTIALIASGTAPPSLPGYTITGASGTIAPKSQPKLSLTLAAAYPVALSGTLNLTITGTLPADPAVQFSTGGRSVAFLIPAGSTSAVFGPTGATVGTSIAFQAGTVASTINVSPTFATQAGAVDLTPSAPSTLQLTVAPAAPSLIGIQLSNLTANGFSIAATAYSTTRTLTSFNVQFTMAAGFTMPQTQFAVDLTQAGNIWFQSATSQTFGGQVVITVPFTFQGTLPTNDTIQNALASVAVSVANEIGASSTATVKLH